MSTETDRIEVALDALLTAAVDDDMRMLAAAPGVEARIFRLTDPVPTRAESEIRALLDQPVGTACRQAIRTLGQRLFEVTGSIDGMREAGERAADKDAQRYGRRVAIVDSAWNGLGSESDRWWS